MRLPVAARSRPARRRPRWRSGSGRPGPSRAASRRSRHSHSGTSGLTSRIGRGVSSRDALEHGQRRLGAERRAAGAHRVQHAAEAEQVGAVVERLALRLLRGHVHRRAGDDPALRQAGVVGGAGQAEVGDLHPLLRPVLQQDVRRLDVAVDQPLLVGRGQPLGDLPRRSRSTSGTSSGPVRSRRSWSVSPATNSITRYGSGSSPARGCARRARAGRRRRPGLAEEPLAGRRGRGQRRGQHLDRDDALEHVVERAEHDADAAAAEDLEHLVVPEPAERVRAPGRREEAERVVRCRRRRLPGACGWGRRRASTLRARNARVGADPGSGGATAGTSSRLSGRASARSSASTRARRRRRRRRPCPGRPPARRGRRCLGPR